MEPKVAQEVDGPFLVQGRHVGLRNAELDHELVDKVGREAP
jgi:hypothetical protein